MADEKNLRAEDDNTQTLLDLLKEYEAENTALRAERDQLEKEVGAKARERFHLLEQVSILEREARASGKLGTSD